jgi:hypothetical protein
MLSLGPYRGVRFVSGIKQAAEWRVMAALAAWTLHLGLVDAAINRLWGYIFQPPDFYI